MQYNGNIITYFSSIFSVLSTYVFYICANIIIHSFAALMQATRVNFEDNCCGNERALSTSRLACITTDPNSHGTYNTAYTNSLHTVNEVDSKDRPEMYCHYVVSMC